MFSGFWRKPLATINKNTLKSRRRTNDMIFQKGKSWDFDDLKTFFKSLSSLLTAYSIKNLEILQKESFWQ